MTPYPNVFRLRQTFEAPRVDDIVGRLRAELARLDLRAKIEPRQTVAVTVGSRGIANLSLILRALVASLKDLGAEPFLVPAMGSHGGATAEGQRRVVESYGITEATVGCPILSSMETVVLHETDEGFPVHFDRLAHEADHVVVCNRVKPHTMFTGDIQSGLLKMMLIGLGKHAGARIYHGAVQDFGFPRVLRIAAETVLARESILAGLAIVENARDETALIEAVPPERFMEREKELLVLARRWMPRLPFDQVDLLLVDRIGKDISGTGMDTNVIGRKFNDHAAVEGERPRVTRIALRGLTEATRGNANGLGMAEFCKSRLLRQTDFTTTRINALTARHVPAAMAPLDYETDREILDAALGTIGLTAPAEAKILWIADTLHLDEVVCSTAYLPEARRREDLTILGRPGPMPLDEEGNLPDFNVGDSLA